MGTNPPLRRAGCAHLHDVVEGKGKGGMMGKGFESHQISRPRCFKPNHTGCILGILAHLNLQESGSADIRIKKIETKRGGGEKGRV